MPMSTTATWRNDAEMRRMDIVLGSMWIEDLERTIARIRAYTATGIDAIFLVGLRSLEQLDAIHAAVKLPLVAPGGVPAKITQQELAARGVRIRVIGHQPLAAAITALRETYAHLMGGGDPAALKSRIATEQEMETWVNNENYQTWMRDYLK